MLACIAGSSGSAKSIEYGYYSFLTTRKLGSLVRFTTRSRETGTEHGEDVVRSLRELALQLPHTR